MLCHTTTKSEFKYFKRKISIVYSNNFFSDNCITDILEMSDQVLGIETGVSDKKCLGKYQFSYTGGNEVLEFCFQNC